MDKKDNISVSVSPRKRRPGRAPKTAYENLSLAAQARLNKKRERNRRAATKSRQQRKDQTNGLSAEVEQLEAQKRDLEKQKRAKEKERLQLEQVLAEHVPACQLLPHQSINVPSIGAFVSTPNSEVGLSTLSPEWCGGVSSSDSSICEELRPIPLEATCSQSYDADVSFDESASTRRRREKPVPQTEPRERARESRRVSAKRHRDGQKARIASLSNEVEQLRTEREELQKKLLASETKNRRLELQWVIHETERSMTNPPCAGLDFVAPLSIDHDGANSSNSFAGFFSTTRGSMAHSRSSCAAASQSIAEDVECYEVETTEETDDDCCAVTYPRF